MMWTQLSIRLGAGWMVISSLSFALMSVFVKLGGQYYHTVELVFWRGVFGVVLMGAMAYGRKESLKTPHTKKHLTRSIAGVVSMFAYFYAVIRLPIATATTLNYTSPVFMVLVSFLFMGIRISRLSVMGIIIGFVGVLLLLQPNFSTDAGTAILVGLSSGLISCIAYIQIQQMTHLKEPEWRIVFYFSVVMCVIPVVFLSLTQTWQPLNLSTSVYLVGMGLCATLAQITMTKAYRVSNLFVVSAFSYTSIIFSTVFGAWLLHDVLHWSEFLAMAVIVASGFLTKTGTKSAT